jgi:XTP/dITP diphosphohydrolase
MKIILSTRNPSKAEQIRALFADPTIELLTLAEAGIEGEGIEDGTTLAENALKKAKFAFGQSVEKSWTMADDTGLFITALNGAPGIKAARWAGDAATTEEIMNHTLAALEGKRDRTATFETVVALISPKGEEQFFSGKVEGVLLDAPRVPFQPKMPYSPLFLPNGKDKVWAEMTTEEENEISHRGQAFRHVRAFLEKNT